MSHRVIWPTADLFFFVADSAVVFFFTVDASRRLAGSRDDDDDKVGVHLQVEVEGAEGDLGLEARPVGAVGVDAGPPHGDEEVDVGARRVVAARQRRHGHPTVDEQHVLHLVALQHLQVVPLASRGQRRPSIRSHRWLSPRNSVKSRETR